MGAAVDCSVGIVGAGGSGIATAVALAREGMPFEVLEARDGIGGTWRYDPSGDGSPCYASLVSNTSRWRTSLVSRRIPGRPWRYVPHAEMLAYLDRLAGSAGMPNHLRTNWRVVSARREDDAWTVRNERGEERRYRALVCALGVNGRPRMAQLPGVFGGQQLHSAGYRTPTPFVGRDVLVIGLGTSGCEVVGELAGQARSVRVSVRAPLWTMTRRLGSFPIDWLDDPRAARLLPWSVRRMFLEGLCRASTGSLYRRGLPRPTRRCGDDLIAVSDTFPRAVRRGLVQFHAGVAAVDDRTVRFADGTRAEVDVIVHATGYELATGFLPDAARPDPRRLYRAIAHTGVEGLHFVGLFEAHHALLPIAGEQAAWAADVLGGRLGLPPSDVQRRTVTRDVARRQRQFGTRRPFMLDHASYIATLRRDRRGLLHITANASSPT